MGLLAAAAHANPASARGLEADLLAAKDAARRGNVPALEALRPRFSGHLLEAYPAYWLLKAQLERGADPAQVQAFLARFADTPLADALRRDWLKALGAAASWDLFRAELPRIVAEDVELSCFAFQARLAQGDAPARDEARSLFLAGHEAAASCEPVFAALWDAGAIAEAQVWERIRKLLAANLVREAKRANAMLRLGVAFNDRALERAASDPVRFLVAEKAPVLSRASRELAVFAVARLARTRPDEAAERLALIAPRLGDEATRHAWGQVAHLAALAHHPRALEWYDEARDAKLTDTQVAWRARAALRAGDWKAVRAAIQAFSPEEAREPAWRYWRARALLEAGSPEAANGLLRALAAETSYYGLLAADHAGVATAPPWDGWKPAQADLDRVRARPGIERALALYRLDLDAEGLREWAWAIRGLDDRDLLAAAEIARLAREPDRAIHTAERTVHVHDFAQRYPTPHREVLSGAARRFDVEEAWLYGIIRQESRFVSEARSRVGAAGLMQLMPATARWVSRQMSMPAYRPAMLAQPEVNVPMGAYYFRQVLTELGEPLLAAAAYNAGPGRARRWRSDQALEGAIYAETIPFDETRDYVKKVLANAWYYNHRLGGRSPGMRQLLGHVAPKPLGGTGPALAATLP